MIFSNDDSFFVYSGMEKGELNVIQTIEESPTAYDISGNSKFIVYPPSTNKIALLIYCDFEETGKILFDQDKKECV